MPRGARATADGNPARKLYDEFVPADEFVHYELDLPRK